MIISNWIILKVHVKLNVKAMANITLIVKQLSLKKSKIKWEKQNNNEFVFLLVDVLFRGTC